LTRLVYNFKKAGQDLPQPDIFLEAIEMLLEDESIKRLDSIPCVRRIIDNWATATAQHMFNIQRWLREEFPTFVTNVAKADV